jgi:hypothetical protein
VREICGNSHESSEIVKHHLSQFFLFNILNKIITHYRWPTTSLFIVNICSPAYLWTFYTIVLQFLQLLHFGHKLRLIHDAFPQHSCF